jgi:preprotein translocase subunit SecB
MADDANNTPEAGNGADQEAEQAPAQINIETQYIKDLSFENPLGPNAGAAIQQNPEVSVEVTTSARPLGEGRYEVSLFIKGEANTKEGPVFITELTYAGVVSLANIPDDAVGPILLIEGARLLFPFARNIVAEVTRDGGFPPLFINPIDFVQLYRDQHMSEEEGEGEA